MPDAALQPPLPSSVNLFEVAPPPPPSPVTTRSMENPISDASNSNRNMLTHHPLLFTGETGMHSSWGNPQGTIAQVNTGQIVLLICTSVTPFGLATSNV
jgi:hypothetical protein